jgi:hypothetical protein
MLVNILHYLFPISSLDHHYYRITTRFRTFFPEHKDKQLYGILAAVDMFPELREKTLEEGFYVARIHDQVFELDTPENFQPQSY